MKLFQTIFVAAVSILVLSVSGSSAGAETISVKSGTSTAFGPFHYYEVPTCNVSPPASYSISRQPQHGTLKMVVRKGTRPVSEGRCPGASGNMLYFVYQPNRGFRGKDQFRVTWSFETFIGDIISPYAATFDVEVK